MGGLVSRLLSALSSVLSGPRAQGWKEGGEKEKERGKGGGRAVSKPLPYSDPQSESFAILSHKKRGEKKKGEKERKVGERGWRSYSLTLHRSIRPLRHPSLFPDGAHILKGEMGKKGKRRGGKRKKRKKGRGLRPVESSYGPTGSRNLRFVTGIIAVAF